MAGKGESRLTDAALGRRKLVDGEKVLLVDGGGLRFTLSLTRQGRAARCVYRFQINGRRRDLYLGTWPSLSLADLRRKRDEARHHVKRGMDPQEAFAAERREREAAEQREAAKLTLQQAFEQWRELHLSKACRDGGLETARIWGKDVLPPVASTYLDQISRADLAAIIDRPLRRGSVRVASLLATTMRQFFSWAQRRGMVEVNPAGDLGVDLPTAPPRQRFLDDVEITLLAGKLGIADLPDWAEPAVWILLGTAVRSGELLGAEWSEFDLPNAVWHLPADRTKSAVGRDVALSDFTLRWLDRLQSKGGEWLFPGRVEGQPIHEKALTKLVKDRQRLPGFTPMKNRRASGLDALHLPGGDWRVHDLRRSAATALQRLGVAPFVIEKCLGHAEPNRLIKTYQRHDFLPEQRAALALLGNHLQSLMG
jgi:integrase